MKALSCTFAALAILLSDVMCAAVAFSYCDMLWGIRYASYSAPASTAFLLVIPYAAAIAVCTALAVIFGEKVQNTEKEPPYGEPYGGFSFTFSQTGCRACSGRSGTRRCSPPASLRRSQTIRTVPLPPSPRPRRSRPPPRG